MGLNRAIGKGGGMPWHLPAELQHFKRATMDKAIVMGRKTWQAIGRPLTGRQNIVVSRDPRFEAQGAVVAGSLAQALEMADSEEVMVIGGGQLYAQALPQASRMVLTIIDIEPEADTWFPDWDEDEWAEVASGRFEADASNPLAYRIVELTRVVRAC
jgi:dihydrofolate reductase